MRTQVAIIGAGPAGSCCPTCCTCRGLNRWCWKRAAARRWSRPSAPACWNRAPSICLTRPASASACGARRPASGIRLAFDGRQHRIDLTELTDRAITVYAQHEVLKDLIAARLAAQGQLYFGVEQVALRALDSDRPQVHYRIDGAAQRIDCDFVIGCDGFHGISRAAMPGGLRQDYTGFILSAGSAFWLRRRHPAMS